MNTIVDRLTSYLPARVAVAPPLEPHDGLLNSGRGQFGAEAVAMFAASTYAEKLRGNGGLVVALTAADIYSESRERWRYAFGTIGPYSPGIRTSVVSTARMSINLYLPLGSAFDMIIWTGEDKITSRAYKMLLKYVGLGFYGLPLSDDPTSVMYNNILGPDDLDRMSDELPFSVSPSSP